MSAQRITATHSVISDIGWEIRGKFQNVRGESNIHCYCTTLLKNILEQSVNEIDLE